LSTLPIVDIKILNFIYKTKEEEIEKEGERERERETLLITFTVDNNFNKKQQQIFDIYGYNKDFNKNNS